MGTWLHCRPGAARAPGAPGAIAGRAAVWGDAVWGDAVCLGAGRQHNHADKRVVSRELPKHPAVLAATYLSLTLSAPWHSVPSPAARVLGEPPSFRYDGLYGEPRLEGMAGAQLEPQPALAPTALQRWIAASMNVSVSVLLAQQIIVGK